MLNHSYSLVETSMAEPPALILEIPIWIFIIRCNVNSYGWCCPPSPPFCYVASLSCDIAANAAWARQINKINPLPPIVLFKESYTLMSQLWVWHLTAQIVGNICIIYSTERHSHTPVHSSMWPLTHIQNFLTYSLKWEPAALHLGKQVLWSFLLCWSGWVRKAMNVGNPCVH